METWSRYGGGKGRSGYEPSDTETDWQDSPWRDLPRNRRDLNGSGSSREEVISPTKRRQHRHAYKSPALMTRNRNGSPFSKSERRRHVSSLYKAGADQDRGAGEKGAGFQSNHGRRAVSASRLRAKGDKEHHNSHGPMSINGPNFESPDSISPGDIFFSRNVLPKIGAAPQGHLLLYPKPTPALFSQAESCSIVVDDDDDNPKNNRISASSGLSSRVTMSTISAAAASRRSITTSSKISSGTNSRINDASGETTRSSKKFAASRRKNRSGGAWFSCVRKGSCMDTKMSPERQAFDESSYIEKAFVVEKLRQFWADKHQPSSFNGFICHKHQAQLLKQLVSDDGCPHVLFKGPSGSGKRALAMALLHEIYGDPSWNVSNDLQYFPVQDKRHMQVLVPLTSSAHHVELNVNLEANTKHALIGLVKEISNNYAIIPEVSNANFTADYKVIVLYEVDRAADNIQHLIKWIMDCYTDACKLILCCEDDADILEPVKNRCTVIKVDAPVTHEFCLITKCGLKWKCPCCLGFAFKRLPIMEVLIQIARKEDFDLPMSFAAKIATKSKQNLRKAIMALEACKAHNYPFVDDQPIPLGWEEVLIELAAEILDDPSTKRLFCIRGKIQTLLVDFVHPKLILLVMLLMTWLNIVIFFSLTKSSVPDRLVFATCRSSSNSFLKDKRLPTGTTALLKIEEFVAKFMSIYRKGSGNMKVHNLHGTA
ncbi:hypothetical protein JRO89_XS08G0150700 [Xanthoceras sorbifolium]|uniref:Replication factor C subunit 3 n=1 Tax=Xanthoceras sorbifolium TaxID=99658 RepID=A0ABQ8HPV3_9ROSI|nr:hypothetical protein JRO89_XS08G0150700 [Xanthoceras sorbifolium]